MESKPAILLQYETENRRKSMNIKIPGFGKLAHVLTMRKLIRTIYYMLSNRKPRKYENITLTERKVSGLKGD